MTKSKPSVAIFSRRKSRFYLVGILLLITLVTNRAYAGFPEDQPSSRSASLGYSAVGLMDGWSLFYNQAGLGFQEHAWIGVHHENRFITPELNFSAIGALVPVNTGTLGISVKRMGFSQFNQTKAGLAYGLKLAPTLSAGVQLNIHHVYIAEEYGSTSGFTAEGGILYNPSPNLYVGLHVLNPTRSKIHENERIPTIFNLGISYKLGEMVLLTTGVEKNLDAKQSFKAGIEFVPIENFSIRTGLASNPSLICFGIGYKLGPIQMDLAFSRHEYMGYTPHFTVAYLFGQREKNISADPAQP